MARYWRLLQDAMPSAAIDLPKMFVLKTKTQQPIPRIMALATIRAGNEAAQVHAVAVEVFGDGKGPAATAGDQQHAKVRMGLARMLLLGVRARHRARRAAMPTIAAEIRAVHVNTIQSKAGIAPKDLRTIPQNHAPKALSEESNVIPKNKLSIDSLRIYPLMSGKNLRRFFHCSQRTLLALVRRQDFLAQS